MMKLLIKASLIAQCFGAVLQLSGQSTIVFEYDEVGNRVERYPQADSRTEEESVVNLTDSLQQEFLAEDKAYPNPTEGILKFSLKLEEPAASRVTLFDLNGRMIYRKRFIEQEFEVDITRQRIGIYLVKWQFADQTRTLKIIKN